ncbi:hypothetical protein [Sphingobacterium sp. MYb382]|uniref:hypothetical protein n=1 Tax=Sphingobacterium sp. MYb382 TaxID=2745278 RepID=UPI0030A3C7B0
MSLQVYLFLILQFFVANLSAQVVPVERTTIGNAVDHVLGELSGMIQSDAYPDKFWTHNDSGDLANIYLMNSKGELEGTYRLEGIDATDMEDVAKYRLDGRTYLVLADIGDNRAVRKHISLYIFEEPKWKVGQKKYQIPRSQIKVINLKYSDKARDAEAIFIDPVDLSCYLISKRDFNVGVYSFPILQEDGAELTLQRQWTLPFTFVTSADIASKGEAVVIKNLTTIYYWKRKEGATIRETLNQPFETLEYSPEPQGEAICFDKDATVFYTISERPFGLYAYLYRYVIKSNESDK